MPNALIQVGLTVDRVPQPLIERNGLMLGRQFQSNRSATAVTFKRLSFDAFHQQTADAGPPCSNTHGKPADMRVRGIHSTVARSHTVRVVRMRRKEPPRSHNCTVIAIRNQVDSARIVIESIALPLRTDALLVNEDCEPHGHRVFKLSSRLDEINPHVSPAEPPTRRQDRLDTAT